MEVVLTSAEMQACDRTAIRKYSMPGLLLMENAGRGVVDAMETRFGAPAGKTFLVVCGKGDNGGDGFVVARHLALRGASVSVLLAGAPARLTPDARANYRILKSLSREKRLSRQLEISQYGSPKGLGVLPGAQFIVDALFGTGFKGAVRSPLKELICWMNDSDASRISIDIPSGLNADDGSAEGVAVHANLTVTMGFKKVGLIVGKARSYTGEIKVVDLGVFGDWKIAERSQARLIEWNDVQRLLPHRPPDAHKHSVGKIYVLAGSRGLTGAAAMAATSAMKAGAGAVILGTAASVYPVLAKKLTEVMVEPLPETDKGSVSVEAFESVMGRLSWCDIAIIGPGLSRHPETRDLVHRIVAKAKTRMLIDADALNVLGEKNSVLKNHKSAGIVLTPHAGELGRLLGVPSSSIDADHVGAARKSAKLFRAAVVLKGAPSVTASEDGGIVINSTGNAGMATAGAGDVLSGLIAGLWGQGMDRTAAAYCGVFIHGAAGDRARERYGEKSLMATDIENFIPDVLRSLEEAHAS